MISLSDVKAARERIAPYVLHTPLLRAPILDEMMGCQVYLKLENTQLTGSFKIRGATNGILCLTDEQRAKGVITTSSGNHAQGMALAGNMFGVKTKIVLPNDCNVVKLANIKSYGVDIVQVDVMIRDDVAAEIVKEEGRIFIHSFADPTVKAGQGTIALEIMEDNPDIDTIIVPIGGGGLISGIAVGAKGIKPSVKVYGIESDVIARYTTCKKNNRLAHKETIGETIADAVRGNRVDQDSYDTINALVDDIILAEDKWIRQAVKATVAKAHVVAEPGSCMGLATAMAGTLPVKPSDKVAFVLSGGNNDLNLLAKIITE